jgi:DNA-binding transcriptional ArsR family regulator
MDRPSVCSQVVWKVWWHRVPPWIDLVFGVGAGRIQDMSELPLHPSADPLQPSLCAKMLAALAAPERLQIIRFLRDGPRNVGDIAKMLRTWMVNTSHHLSVLKVAGLIQAEKRGRFVFYSVVPGVLQLDSGASIDHVNLGCCQLSLPRQAKDAQE